MIKRLLASLFLLAIATTASAAFDIGQLMSDLARHKEIGRASCRERVYVLV